MHTPQDDINNVNLSYLVNMTKLIIGVMGVLADINPPPLIRIVSPKIGYIYILMERKQDQYQI